MNPRSGLVAAGLTATLAAALIVLGACGPDGDSKAESGSGSGSGSGSKPGPDALPELKVSGAYVPQPPTEDMAGGYFTVRNSGAGADRLTSVSSDVAGDVEMHETVKNQMRKVSTLTVPADGTLELGRGGNHLMLMELKRKPVKGETVTFVLHFKKSGPITVKAPVEATNYTPKK